MNGSKLKKNRIKNKFLCFLLAFCWITASIMSDIGSLKAEAAPVTGKKLTLKTCRELAIANSMEYENAEDAISSKQAAYESAVKAINLKEKSLKQFRWTPLLNFKFPTDPSFAEASEFQYKPVALQYEIQVAEHNLQDKTYAISETVNNLYVEIVVLQKNIEFNEQRAEALEKGLAKNQARLKIGEANKADVDKLDKKLKSVQNSIASSRRTLEADLKKLTKMVGFDVTTGYTFETPFLEAAIDRDQLDALKQYTEDRDETYYEACVAETTAEAELNTNYGLIKNKYGGDFNMISSYVNGALNGNNINKKGFKNDYKSFLNKVDSYWNGKKRILFIKIPRLWFKGDMDGTRYIEDDPYVLYQNVLDYTQASNEKIAAKETLDQSVEDTFNSYISVRNSYQQYLKDVDEASANLEKSLLLNRIGELTFEEYDSQMESYEELQNGMMDAMKLYTQTLYSFDRLTCGGISAILSGTDADMQTAVVGESYTVRNSAQANYSLKRIIQNQEFELSISIPEDFEVEISDFELWVDNIMVGERTPIDSKLRHLALTMDSVSEVKIRLYNDGEFVDDCQIDPSKESGILDITTGYDIKKNESDELGTFTIDINENTGIVELTILPKDENVKKFKILTEDGQALGSDELQDIEKPFKYISLIQQSLDELRIELYDESGGLVQAGRFDDLNGLIYKFDTE